MNPDKQEAILQQIERLQAHFGKLDPLAIKDWLKRALGYSEQEVVKAVDILIETSKYKPKFNEFSQALAKVQVRKPKAQTETKPMTIEQFRKEQAELWIDQNMAHASKDEKFIAKMWIDELITCQHGSKCFNLPFGILMKLNLNEDCNHAGRAICRDVIEFGWVHARDNKGQYDGPGFDIKQYNIIIPDVVWDSYNSIKAA